MTSKELEEILKSPITKAAKGRFISIEQLEQIKTDLEILDILLKCVRVSTIQYDDNDRSTSCNEFCFEFDELSNEEYLKLCKYLSKYIELEVEDAN